MREILVISGKGGTGKTSFTAAFAHLADNHILCDLDVDAPDLHLLLQPDVKERHDFHAGFEAQIIAKKCASCDTCFSMCQFDAVCPNTPYPMIDPLKCEGCKVCVQFCPADAISFSLRHCGRWYTSDTRLGPLVHAQLFPGEENSGRLVALLRQKAKAMAKSKGLALILSDGPPGIGCPVISSLSGVSLAVMVTEPTLSGIHDMERITDLCGHFKIPIAVIINKCDINEKMTRRIKTQCRQKAFAVVAQIPYDSNFIHAMVQGKTMTEYSNGATAMLIRQAWRKIIDLC